MAYLTQNMLKGMNFKYLGKNIKISSKASIYNPEEIEINSNSRIDDFCIISGKVKIGSNVHVAPFCLVAGGEKGIILEDFVGLAYNVQVFAQSDDYSGKTMTNPTVSTKYKNEYKKEVIIKKHSIIGTSSVVLPGVIMQEGTSIGVMSVVRKSTEAWTIYIGNPAKKLKKRSKDLLKLEKDFINSMNKIEN